MAKRTKRKVLDKPEAAEATEAQQQVEKLIGWGMRGEEIAYRMRVSLNSIVRWRRGVVPWPGHMADLKELVETVQKERSEKKKKTDRDGEDGGGGGGGSGSKVRRLG